MVEIIGALPSLAGLVEKGGVIAVLIIIIVVLVKEVVRLRAEIKAAYVSRDKYRVGFAICKAECDRANIRIDLSLVNELSVDAQPG